MATKKIRVYELARELGVENQVVLDLAERLKIGVKSHSSSIDDPSADRVRRLADSEGLRREPVVDEPEPEAPPAKKVAPKVVAGGRAPSADTSPAGTPPAPAPAPVRDIEPSADPAVLAPAARVADIEPVAATAPPGDEPLAPHRVVRSTGVIPDVGPARPAPAPAERPAASAPAPAPAAPAPPPAAAAPAAPAPAPEAPADPEPAAGPPRSVSGKPIPPPPGGRRIPPPPGPRVPPGTPGAPRTGGDFRSGTGPRPTGGGGGGAGFGQRPGGGGGGFGQRPGGGPGGGPGGPGGRGGPGGGPGGPGGGRGRPGPQGQRPRRKKRRRRDFEDLGPASLPQLTPHDAPVPVGEIVVERGSTIQELAPKLNRTTADLVRLLFDAGEMVTGTQSLADEMIDLIAESLGAEVLLVEPGQEAELELQAMLGDDDEFDEALLEPRRADRHRDGPCRPRQDDVARLHPQRERRRGRGRWHHPAHRRVPGRPQRPPDHLHRHARPRGVHRHACARGPCDRHRGARRRGRRRRDAPDDGGDQPRRARPTCRSSWPSPRPTVRMPTRRECASSSSSRGSCRSPGVATRSSSTSPRRPVKVSRSCSRRCCWWRSSRSSGRTRRQQHAALVLESNLDQGRGPVVTALVDKGTLRVGDPIVAGGAWGKVRALFDERGDSVQRGRPVGARRGARPRRRAARGRRAAGRPRREDRAHRRRGPGLPSPDREPEAPDEPGGRRPSGRHLRDGPARRGRHAQRAHQGRHAGLARGAHRRAAQARPGPRRGAPVVRAPRRRRDQRIRREPRCGVERHGDRIQRAARSQGAASSRRSRASTCACTR